jgi:ABC-type amino acid transport substrate-binding protein
VPRWLESRRVSATLIALVSFALTACDLPRDPEGTTDRVRGGTLRVGACPDAPGLILASSAERRLEPQGAEAEIVRRLAGHLGARVEWRTGGESRLFRALEAFELDLVVGGIDRRSPWGRSVGLTRPFAQLDRPDEVWAVPPGENEWLVTVERFLAADAREGGR